MRITLRNSDVVASYKAAFISSVIARAAWKNKFFKLLPGSLNQPYPYPYKTTRENSPTYYDRSFIVFQTPINDGWLNSAKEVASFFFPTYTYGLQHWDGTLDHLWPVVCMFPMSRAEVDKFIDFLVITEIRDGHGWSPELYFCIDSQTGELLEPVYFEIFNYVVSVEVYDEFGNVVGYADEQRSGRRFFYYDIDAIKNSMGSLQFFEWFSVDGRIDQRIEYESGGFFDTVFGGFVSGLLALATGGPVGLGIWIGTKFAIEIYGDIVADDPAASSSTTTKEEMLWSSDDDEYLSDNIMAVPPLPRY